VVKYNYRKGVGMSNKKLVQQVYESIDRSFFMDINKDLAYLDSAIPIGYGQTISQPSLVLYMTEQLDIHAHNKVLEIGTGTGYQTAFLASLAKEVYTVERIEALHLSTKERLNLLGFTNIHYYLFDGSYGLEEHQPYDRIMFTAAASSIPDYYIDQLAENGVLIIPVGNASHQDLLRVTKLSDGSINETSLEAVRFVPLVGEYEIT
jgi:protein-L-isoaspartate(D-aspartate) O-methyltransferase